MAQTLASSTALLCPVSEFLKRVDQTAVGKLASNTTTPVSSGALATDPNVLAALQDASGLVESAISVGGRYSQADVAAILAAPTSAAAGMMYRIVTDLAWTCLFERRPNRDAQTPPSMQRSLEWLEMLSQGKRIFAFVETEAAGVMERVEATVEDVFERNGSVVQARPLYGQRSDQTCPRFG